MTWIQQEDYLNRLDGCWLGKCIGGTLGQPFEGVRGVLDISDYTQDMSQGAEANDDLDLQLAWLIAIERFGPSVDATVLAEFWLDYIHPNWAEYGVCKNNLRIGLLPPFSGSVCNRHADSNGAWIRTEIWACLMPGQPSRAASYAIEDARVDHSGEGVYAAAFCAAIQSAAFSEKQLDQLLDLAVSHIPENCGVARAVASVRQSYADELDWREARRKLLLEVPDSFGIRWEGEPGTQMPKGKPGYDAPASIGIVVLGLLYGRDDFTRTLLTTVNCGLDTDCTAATVGALWGIMYGSDAIPDRWKHPIGRNIRIGCLTGDLYTRFPQTIDELNERIVKAALRFAEPDMISMSKCGFSLKMLCGDGLFSRPVTHTYKTREMSYYDYKRHYKPYCRAFKTPIYTLLLDMDRSPMVTGNSQRDISVHFHNHLDHAQWLRLTWISLDGVQIEPGCQIHICLSNHFETGQADFAFQMTLPASVEKMTCYLDIESLGRPTRLVIPVVFLAGDDLETIG